jgi:hypothetical protein
MYIYNVVVISYTVCYTYYHIIQIIHICIQCVQKVAVHLGYST